MASLIPSSSSFQPSSKPPQYHPTNSTNLQIIPENETQATSNLTQKVIFPRNLNLSSLNIRFGSFGAKEQESKTQYPKVEISIEENIAI
ncbi:uncharacterized protein G2W53_027311 [Senna tora]|uniref:Uncharacterized protein n=1 Tax=Senna tora TaxID=362788 RepID=A0A834WJQ7_9FABA|nr:uncharacterized protein G2W53_027311 [Senna tora]